jgi:hypothetical protein
MARKPDLTRHSRFHKMARRMLASKYSRGLERDLMEVAIGISYEHPSEDLAYLGYSPRFRNHVVKAVLPEIRHGRRIRIAAGDD